MVGRYACMHIFLSVSLTLSLSLSLNVSLSLSHFLSLSLSLSIYICIYISLSLPRGMSQVRQKFLQEALEDCHSLDTSYRAPEPGFPNKRLWKLPGEIRGSAGGIAARLPSRVPFERFLCSSMQGQSPQQFPRQYPQHPKFLWQFPRRSPQQFCPVCEIKSKKKGAQTQTILRAYRIYIVLGGHSETMVLDHGLGTGPDRGVRLGACLC